MRDVNPCLDLICRKHKSRTGSQKEPVFIELIVDFPFTGLASIIYLPLRLWKQSELLSEISGLCHGGKVATQSVGNMLASVVTHLPVL